MTGSGVVRSFDAEEGWGVIDGPDVPGGCWVHFSAIAMTGYRELAAGQTVSFRAEAADQDGFAFRAVKVWTGDRAARPAATGEEFCRLSQHPDCELLSAREMITVRQCS